MPRLLEKDRLIPNRLIHIIREENQVNFFMPKKWSGVRPLAQNNRKPKELALSLLELDEIDATGVNIAAARIARLKIIVAVEGNPLSGDLSMIKSHPFLKRLQWQSSMLESKGVSNRSNPNDCIFIEFDRMQGREKGVEKVLDHASLFLRQKQLDRLIPNFELMLMEIVKNTFDHSTKASVLAIETKSNGNSTRLNFSYVENDIGFSRSVREYITKTNKHVGRATKGAWTDLIHLLFTPRFTTKPHTGLNKGMGFSIICQCAAGLNADMYLFDAESIHYLTHKKFVDKVMDSSPSHRLLRQCSFSLGHKVPFGFVGSIRIDT